MSTYHKLLRIFQMTNSLDSHPVGGDYSHAAICVNIDERDGPRIVESTKKGVVENPLAPDISGQEYVDVYRFEDLTFLNQYLEENPNI